MNRLKIKFGFFSILTILALVITGNKYTYLSLFAALVHEIGHLAASKFLGIHLCEFSFGILGARLKVSEQMYSYSQEIVLCFFGPLFNFLSAYAVYIIANVLGKYGESIEFFVLTSVSLGVLNLMPIHTFDGGRIFEATLLKFFNVSFVSRLTNILSFFTVFFLWCISVYFLMIYSSSLGLFVFSVSLFCSLFINECE